MDLRNLRRFFETEEGVVITLLVDISVVVDSLCFVSYRVPIFPPDPWSKIGDELVLFLHTCVYTITIPISSSMSVFRRRGLRH